MVLLFKTLQTSQVWMHLARRSMSAAHNGLRRALLRPGEVVVERQGEPSLVLSSMWLRDHCRAEDRYSHQTNQRAVDLKTTNLSVEPKHVEIKDENLNVNWEDGRISCYNISWIDQNYQQKELVPPRLWGHIEQDEVLQKSQLQWQEFADTDTGVEGLLSSLMKYGIGQVTTAPVCKDAGTRAAVERMFPVLQTAYDDVWQFSNEMLEGSSDSSYTDLALASHTDGTYFTEAPGLQVFHCIQVADGGETVLTDGWNVASKFKKSHPEDYQLLSTVPMSSEYIYKDHQKHIHHKSTDVVFKHCLSRGDLLQFRYNTYDRAPLNTIPHNQIPAFYQALQNLEREMANPDNEIRFTLQPGNVLFVDNWRVTHGRTAIRGHRIMSGCYVARADWRSKARAFGLLT